MSVIAKKGFQLNHEGWPPKNQILFTKKLVQTYYIPVVLVKPLLHVLHLKDQCSYLTRTHTIYFQNYYSVFKVYIN